MILVTLGTQKEQFNRILEDLDKCNLKEEIVVQAGHTKYENKNWKIFDFIPYEEMDKYLKECDLVITHAGTGSIISPLRYNKKVIACARLAKYNEHVDDHQLQIMEVMVEGGYILGYNDGDNLSDVIKKAKTFKPNHYESNTNHFLEELKKEIDN